MTPDVGEAERVATSGAEEASRAASGAALNADGASHDDGAVARAVADADEARIIARVQRGDTAAYDALVRRHLRRAYHLAYRILERREDAEDLVQEAFMVALDRIDTFDVTRPFAPWLSRIVLTRALNARKAAARRRGAPLGEDAVAMQASPLAAAETNDVHERVRAALASLPERQRVIIQLFELDGYSAQEVADSLGLSAGTVRWHAHEARRALRAKLESMFGQSAEREHAPNGGSARSSEGDRR